MVSIVMNYGIGKAIDKNTGTNRKIFLALGVSCDLLILGYYKYAGFLVASINGIAGKELLPDTLADPAVEAVSETGSATVSVDEPAAFVLPDAGGIGVDAGGTGAGGAGAGSEITEKSAVAVPVVDSMAML